jgi:hypothetical protein
LQASLNNLLHTRCTAGRRPAGEGDHGAELGAGDPGGAVRQVRDQLLDLGVAEQLHVDRAPAIAVFVCRDAARAQEGDEPRRLDGEAGDDLDPARVVAIEADQRRDHQGGELRRQVAELVQHQHQRGRDAVDEVGPAPNGTLEPVADPLEELIHEVLRVIAAEGVDVDVAEAPPLAELAADLADDARLADLR